MVPQKNSNLEQKALKLIFDSGDDGLLQSELWKGLGVSSREGSRIAKKFEKKGKVKRKKILNDGRWTYRIYNKREPVTLDSVRGCPCLVCDEVDKCFRGGTKDPVYCLLLTQWIDPRIQADVSK